MASLKSLLGTNRLIRPAEESNQKKDVFTFTPKVLTNRDYGVDFVSPPKWQEQQ